MQHTHKSLSFGGISFSTRKKKPEEKHPRCPLIASIDEHVSWRTRDRSGTCHSFRIVCTFNLETSPPVAWLHRDGGRRCLCNFALNLRNFPLKSSELEFHLVSRRPARESTLKLRYRAIQREDLYRSDAGNSMRERVIHPMYIFSSQTSKIPMHTHRVVAYERTRTMLTAKERKEGRMEERNEGRMEEGGEERVEGRRQGSSRA